MTVLWILSILRIRRFFLAIVLLETIGCLEEPTKFLGETCQHDGQCYSGICAQAVCGTCRTDQDCGGGNVCVQGECSECSSDQDCRTKYMMDPQHGRCLSAPIGGSPLFVCGQCMVSADCAASEYCDSANRSFICNSLVLCSSEADCPLIQPRCISHVCNECATDADCKAGTRCTVIGGRIKKCT